jgi:hypothetical protein
MLLLGSLMRELEPGGAEIFECNDTVRLFSVRKKIGSSDLMKKRFS